MPVLMKYHLSKSYYYNSRWAYYNPFILMLLYPNKKSQDIPKMNKRQRPAPLSLVKTKSYLPNSPTLRGEPLRIAALDSLEIRCEGMKLNTRDSRSPDRRKKYPLKVSRTDTIIKPILLTNFKLPLSSSVSFYKHGFQPMNHRFPYNPEESRDEKVQTIIPSQHLLLYHESKYVELKERIAFFMPRNHFAGLHAWQEGKKFPKIQGLLQSWGVCYLGNQQKKFFVSELYFGYSFRNLMSEFGKLEDCTARLFLRQLVTIVSNLHLLGYSHNRLNLDSIMHNCQGKLLINFFKATLMPVDDSEKQSYLYYFSPEMILSKSGYKSEKNDIWAIGCIALQFLSKKTVRVNAYHPYNRILMSQLGKSSILREKLEKIIDKKEGVEIKLQEEVISSQAFDFIGSCLRLEGSQRPLASQLLLHPFLRE